MQLRILLLNKSEAFYEIFHYTIYYNGTHESFPITLGECEYGKNVNLRYKDLLEKYKQIIVSIKQ